MKPNFAIVQYDNRKLSANYSALQEINKQYCKRHGYTYIFLSHYVDLPLYWIKVKVVKELLHQFDGILWMDSDAVIYNPTKRFDTWVTNGPEKKSFYMAPDIPYWMSYSPFNAGVWLVLNDNMGNSIMNDWLNAYETFEHKQWTQTTYSDVKSKPTFKTSASWAGQAYDQGAFVNYIFENDKYKDAIHSFQWYVLQAHPLYKQTNEENYTNDIFTLHFSGYLKDDIPRWLQSGHHDASTTLADNPKTQSNETTKEKRSKLPMLYPMMVAKEEDGHKTCREINGTTFLLPLVAVASLPFSFC